MDRVIINAVSAKSGGAVTYIRNLISELAKTETQFHYFFYVPKDLAEGIKVLGNNVIVVGINVSGQSAWKRIFWDQVALRRIIRKERIKVLFSSSDFGMLFPPCRQILFLRNSLFFSPSYFKSILPRKSFKFRLDFTLRRWLINQSAKFSDVVITASQSMMTDVQQSIPMQNGKGVVNFFGVPLGRFSRNPSTPLEAVRRDADRPFQILFVSEYSDYKNLTTLLKAVLFLREKGITGFRLVTTADPSQFPDVEIVTREEDRALASHPLIAPFVKFTGPVPYENIPKLYTESDLFVFPSLAESFGHPLVEAMASGLPIIASDIPICREICGDAALYFSPLHSYDLAEKIVLLWNDPDLRKRLGKIGRERAEARFNWRDHVRRLIEIIERMADNG